MKKTGLALLISSLLAMHAFADDKVNYHQLLNERNISELQNIINQNPDDAEAYYTASVYYAVGDDELGTNKDAAKQEEYLKKSADLGYAEAELQYGFSLLNAGKSEEGLSYLAKAADQDYLKAITLLGDLYFAGYQDRDGNAVVQQDLDQAMIYLNKGIEQGSQDARYTLGHIYLDKDLGHHDIDKAVELFQANIDYDNKTGHLPSIVTLLDLYNEGKEVKADRGKLLDLYYLANLQEYAPSYYTIGVLQRTGDKGEKYEIAQDPEAAFVNLQKAAQSGYVDAMFRVGEMFFKGEGTEQSDMNAYVWMAIAEELSGSETKYSETVLELIPKRQRQIAIDNKNHYRQFFTEVSNLNQSIASEAQ